MRLSHIVLSAKRLWIYVNLWRYINFILIDAVLSRVLSNKLPLQMSTQNYIRLVFVNWYQLLSRT